MKTIEKAKLDSLFAQLAQNYSLLVPVDYNGLTQFAPYSQVQEGVSQLYLDGNVTVSPKTAYLQGTLHLVIGLAIALILGLPLANLLF